MSNLPKKGRLDFIDAVRGIAAVAVLFQHGLEFAGFTDPADGFGRNYVNFGQAGVAAFFLVSGFVIPLGLERWGSIWHFWVGRFARIHPLYFFIFSLNLVFLNKAGFWDLNLFEVLKLTLIHALFLQDYIHAPVCVGASWTLSVEMVWYVIFSLAFIAGRNKNIAYLIYPLVFVVLGLAAVSLYFSVRIPLGRFDLLLLCVQGLLIYRLYLDQISMAAFRKYSLVAWLGIFVGQGVSFGWFGHSELSLLSISVSWVLGVALFVSLYVLRGRDFVRHPLLLKAGLYSYSLYLVHPFLIDLLKLFGLTGWVGFFALMLTTVFGSLLTFHLIEKPVIDAAARYRKWSLAKASAG